MTRDEVLAMEPGRELDRLVAEKVTGYVCLTTFPNTDGTFGFIPKYSADIAAVWEAVERLDDCLHLRQHGDDGNWEAFFCGAGLNKKANADTAPEAICKAALLVVLNRG